MGFNEVWRVTFSIINAICTPVLIVVICGMKIRPHRDFPPLLLLCLFALTLNVHLNMLNLERTFKRNRRLFTTILSCSILIVFFLLLTTEFDRVILYPIIINLFDFIVKCYVVISSIIVLFIDNNFEKHQNTAIGTEMNTIERLPE
ncbi:uncharacterized protein LOC132793198 [Drosophila nasuta]|uniref:uncharacterized protein LOC132793198 n=1 Tax=Drosophila nasuta TaxID=42062 RepID=UPI00295EDBD9|nr:uncharacterized protein LOC132793198 [Drosophila nasuta]